jgi:hypothetical protein
MTAVAQNGMALEYASDEMKSDKEVATVAVMQDERAMEYVANALKTVVLKERINKLESEGIIIIELQGVDQLSSGCDMNEGEEKYKRCCGRINQSWYKC